VAILTGVGALRMVGGFARRGAAVMTTDTTALYLRVIDPAHRAPARRGMAALTQIAGGDMVTRFASGGAAVVAADTVTGHAAVIESRPGKGIGVVAILAGVRALRVVGGFARCRAAVMATDTAALHLGMIHLNRGRPA